MVKQYLLSYKTTKRNSKLFSKIKYIESEFNVHVFANDEAEAIELARSEIMNSYYYSGIDNFCLSNISIIE